MSPAISLRFNYVHTTPAGKKHKFLLDHLSLLSFYFFVSFYLTDAAQEPIALVLVLPWLLEQQNKKAITTLL